MGGGERRVVERIEVRIQPWSEGECREQVRREQAARERLGVGRPAAWAPPQDRERERGAEDRLREATEGQEEG